MAELSVLMELRWQSERKHQHASRCDAEIVDGERLQPCLCNQKGALDSSCCGMDGRFIPFFVTQKEEATLLDDFFFLVVLTGLEPVTPSM